MRWIRIILTGLCVYGQAQASDINTELEALGRAQAARIAARADVIEQVQKQNRQHAALSQEEILTLDAQWRAQFGKPDSGLIHDLMNTPLSDALRHLQLHSDEMITELIIMDNRGLNVAQSSVTSDYWQGDEKKWLMTFSVGPGAVHIGKMRKDDSTGTLQIQVSQTITDPGGNAIGAVTVGINALPF